MRILTDTEPLERFQPIGPYRREIEGADFSLEANTPAVPARGLFYLLRRGRILFKSAAFKEALAAYQKLAGEYWQKHLHSRDPRQRLSSAWGLLGLDPQNPDAAAVIAEDGDASARQRLTQLRHRRTMRGRALTRRSA